MRQILIIAPFVLVCTLLNGCRQQIDRPEADKRAQVALEGYSKSENLILTKFSTADVEDHGSSWFYKYTYDEKPRQLVSIIVSKDGRTEVTRMFEEKSVP